VVPSPSRSSKSKADAGGPVAGSGSAGPPLPPGRVVELGPKGSAFVREVAGPPDATTVLLLHGLTAVADLNWFGVFEPLGRDFRVVSAEQRGPACGLEELADRAVAVADALGIERFVVVGYSMGGAVAQLVWRRHPARLVGLVLCATAARFAVSRTERVKAVFLPAASKMARLAPSVGRRYVGQTLISRFDGLPWRDWAVAELARHHPATTLAYAAALARFSSEQWLGEVDVPAVVLVPNADRLVPTERQLRLAEAIPGAQVIGVDGDHGVFVTGQAAFADALLDACRRVT
jgi:3-oxoadipate enol-lactonase